MTPAEARPQSRKYTAALVGMTLLLRLTTLSSPYYVDGPNHVKAVMDGTLFIQPPGYFLFALSARWLMLISHLSGAGISAAAAVAALNVAFSVAGVWIFRRITAQLFPGWAGLLLACCYAVSNVVWFAAEIHSTYASMTFFAPALFYVVVLRARFVLGWLLWAVMTGFRPSDGVFLLPFMIYALFYAPPRRPWREWVWGIAAAVAVCACWYVPTLLHFGGLLAPFSAANRQLGQLPSGLLAHGVTAKGLNNLLHFGFGAGNAWNILLPFAIAGLWENGRVKWACVAWMAPALLFFALYFVSDSMYFAFLVAPGMVLAGYGVRRLWSSRGAVVVYAASFSVACVHMLLLRPIPARSAPAAVMDSYSLEYSAWALKHHYSQRLSKVMDELRNK